MSKTAQVRSKQERVLEAVRRGLEGDAALEFVHESGFAMKAPGFARHVGALGGRERIEELIAQGLSNVDILRARFPDDAFDIAEATPPEQRDLFGKDAAPVRLETLDDAPLYETTKLTISLPSDVYEAIRLAAKAEKKSRNALIAELLTASLSRMPRQLPLHEDES